MRTVDLIHLKRQGKALEPEQIRGLIEGYVSGSIPDYQISALLMAIYFRGMDAAELAALSDAMMRSGETYDLSSVPGAKADKHSTGGVGDKVSLILAPLAAACGLVVPMISGRGLGHTGGTLDKLEAIPGFRTGLSRTRFIRQLGKIGVAMGAQTKQFVPADRKMYALRDVTATVESIPLIAASIMSKKMAEGCDALVLDVKTGNGAFMSDPKDALVLAQTMVGIGRNMGRNVSAMITDMNQPLGRAVGNANEVVESIDCLRGEGPPDLMRVVEALTARMLVLGGVESTEAEALRSCRQAICSGAALEKFRQLVEAQGGDPRCIDKPSLLPAAPKRHDFLAMRGGYVQSFETRKIGVAAMVLGAGREVSSDPVDPGVGLEIMAKIGDRVEKGQPLFGISYRRKAQLDAAVKLLGESIIVGGERRRAPRLIHRREVEVA